MRRCLGIHNVSVLQQEADKAEASAVEQVEIDEKESLQLTGGEGTGCYRGAERFFLTGRGCRLSD